jgi:hypothetical protein
LGDSRWGRELGAVNAKQLRSRAGARGRVRALVV